MRPTRVGISIMRVTREKGIFAPLRAPKLRNRLNKSKFILYSTKNRLLRKTNKNRLNLEVTDDITGQLKDEMSAVTELPADDFVAKMVIVNA